MDCRGPDKPGIVSVALMLLEPGKLIVVHLPCAGEGALFGYYLGGLVNAYRHVIAVYPKEFTPKG